MPRSSVSISFRQAAEARYSSEVDLGFLTISHPQLSESVRVVSDTIDYSWAGFKWIGFQFDVRLLSDDDQPPKAQLVLQNVDRIIGETVQHLTAPPRLRLQLLSSVDFDLSVRPRVPLGTPSIVYDANHLWLTNVKVDAIEMTADIVGWDYGQRAWPGIRATQARCPGLYR
jgi:hypothetical protein